MGQKKRRANIRKLEEQLQKSSRKTAQLTRMLSLYEVSQAMSSTLELDVLLKLILKTAKDCLEADTGSIMLLEGSLLHIKASMGLQKGEITSTIPVGERISGYVAKTGEPVLLVGDATKDKRFRYLKPRKEICSSLCVPVQHNGAMIGVLNLNTASPGKTFHKKDIPFASILASKAGALIENSRLFAQLKEKLEELKAANEEIQSKQALLIQQEKMASMGQLAAGVAHEIQSPLTSIIGYITLLGSESLFSDDRTKNWLKLVKDESERLSMIVRELLNFARKKPQTFSHCQVNQLIQETLLLTRPTISKTKSIKVHLNLAQRLPEIHANPHALKQVFLNISINALHAMPEGGELFIETSMFDGNNVQIKFRDTGVGISEENLEKIFIPFFSTRTETGGTGLGLSICKEIVTQHMGSIRAESEIGKGTTFCISLPQKPDPALKKQSPKLTQQQIAVAT